MPQISRERERESAVVFVLVLNVSLVSFRPPFFRSSLFLGETKRTTLSLSLSLLSSVKHYEK